MDMGMRIIFLRRWWRDCFEGPGRGQRNKRERVVSMMTIPYDGCYCHAKQKEA